METRKYSLGSHVLLVAQASFQKILCLYRQFVNTQQQQQNQHGALLHLRESLLLMELLLQILKKLQPCHVDVLTLASMEKWSCRMTMDGS